MMQLIYQDASEILTSNILYYLNYPSQRLLNTTILNYDYQSCVISTLVCKQANTNYFMASHTLNSSFAAIKLATFLVAHLR